jgi:hypothetical protein
VLIDNPVFCYQVPTFASFRTLFDNQFEWLLEPLIEFFRLSCYSSIQATSLSPALTIRYTPPLRYFLISFYSIALVKQDYGDKKGKPPQKRGGGKRGRAEGRGGGEEKRERKRKRSRKEGRVGCHLPDSKQAVLPKGRSGNFPTCSRSRETVATFLLS